MKRYTVATLAFFFALAAAPAVNAQLRHDDKPHGPAKSVDAKLAQARYSLPGRHDERPHAITKTPTRKAAEKKQRDGDNK